MAVRAEQGKIADASGAFPANVQRLDVVAFDVPAAAFPVKLAEVELAYLAGERSARRDHAADLLPPQGRVSLPVGMPAQEVPSLHLAFALVTHLAREVRRFARRNRWVLLTLPEGAGTVGFCQQRPGGDLWLLLIVLACPVKEFPFRYIAHLR